MLQASVAGQWSTNPTDGIEFQMAEAGSLPNSVDLRAQLARITRNYVISDDDESEAVQVQQAKGFVESVLALTKNGTAVKLHEDPGHRLHYGATIWRCCRFLCNYFDERPAGFYQGKRVLELGSGTALAALAIASLGAKVIATDTSMALPLIRHNLELNPGVVENVQIAELEWYDAPKYISEFSPPFDFLIASDVIYNATAHRALVNVISLLASNNTTIYVAYQERGVPGSQEKFFGIMQEKGFIENQRFTKTEDGGAEGTLVLHVVLLSKNS
eukprot:Phypoly_transcript_08122.p1 GENE.Phypoly_transcript_08122~~Phypoly_transcript_08122.p1  ORF type:complete len:273 (-),score=33.51 Phypoly_transcript_08122:91-909(-)